MELSIHSYQSDIVLAREEKISEADFLSKLPDEIIFQIFSYLSCIELTNCEAVSRKCRRLSSNEALWDALDLRTMSPLIKVFDESDWKKHVDLDKYGLSFEGLPPLNKRKVISFLNKHISPLAIKGNKGVTIMDVPKKLAFNKLVEIAKSPKLGNATKVRYIWERISAELGNIQVNKAYRIVIANNIFEESEILPFKAQKALVSQNGCEMPRLTEIIALIVVTFMSTGERLYNDKPWTYICTLPTVDRYPVVVGGFSLNGIYVNCNIIVYDYPGVGGVLREF